jgi:hypothetical protein
MSWMNRYAAVALVSSVFLATGGVRWSNAVPNASTRPAEIERVGPQAPLTSDSALAADADLIVSNDAFRLSNTPADVRFDPARDNSAQPQGTPAPLPVRPVMSLKAIVGGPPWEAIVDGIPGQASATTVRSGAVFDKLVARAVTRDSVVIQGPDTTWVLSFRRAP